MRIDQKFGKQRRLRKWGNGHRGGFGAAKLHPLFACRFRPDEGGTLETFLDTRLAPVDGILSTKAYLQVLQVFVPYQAMDVLQRPFADSRGVTEMCRREILEGRGVGLEVENAISRACFAHGKNVDGTVKVQKSVRLAYIAALNHLRKKAYFNALIADHTLSAIMPCTYKANMLQRFDGVLDPESLIDGAINLSGSVPLSGIEIAGSVSSGSGGASVASDGSSYIQLGHSSTGYLRFDLKDASNVDLAADLSGAAELTHRDLMRAKILDGIVRNLARVREMDPVHGEERVARAIYGVQMNTDDEPVVIYDQTHELEPQHIRPMDAAGVNKWSGHFHMFDTFGTVVPRTELGGQVMTFVCLRPLELVPDQPDPAQTEAWVFENRIHDELDLEEQMVTRRDLEASVPTVDADVEAFWVGKNRLMHNYMTEGINVEQVPEVEVLTKSWDHEIPQGVTPENINYPETISMYPFFNWTGPAAQYVARQRAHISTPLQLGPNPVEKLELFEADPSLIEEVEA